MPGLYLTPASLGYLTQFIIALMITGYLISRLASPRAARPAHSMLLAGFFACIALLTFLFFLESSLRPSHRLYALYLQNTALAAGIVLLLQFAYRFPAALPRQGEAFLVLGLSVAYLLYEAGYADHRFWLLFTRGEVIFRPPWADYPMALGLLWAPVIFVRQALRASVQAAGAARAPLLYHLWRPQGNAARTARALALVYLLPFGVSLLTILKSFYFIPPDMYQLSLSLGVLAALAAFAVIYLNYLPEMTSFLVKLAGLTLVALLAVLGSAGWALTPIYTDLYRPVWPDHQTLRFTPNAGGGYDVALVLFHFESDLGAKLNLADSADPTVKADVREAGATLNFTFPFYGKTYSQIYVTNDGSIAMGREAFYRDYLYHYGGQTPFIFPMLLDLIPEASQGGGIFARQEPDRLVITADRVPSFYHRADVFTFQVVLYRDGFFDVTYNGLPDHTHYRADSEPWANVWVVGATPGDETRWPQLVELSRLAPGQVITGGPAGLVQDYYLGFRRHLHTLLLPLAYLMGVTGLLAVTVFPYMFHLGLVKPLNALMDGVRQIEQGRLDVAIPVYYHDEIGFLARSFNRMALALNDLVSNLEKRVAERTRALEAQNAELDSFAHTVAHDLKGPLSILAAHAEMLSLDENPLDAAERQNSLQALTRGAHKAAKIVDSLLLLAITHKQAVTPHLLDMHDIVSEAIGRLDAEIKGSQAEISLPPAQAWPQAWGYAPWIEEVWVNYLGNALKYGCAPGAPPRVELGALEQAEGAVRFWVRDYGPGLAPEQASRLFTPFERLSQARVSGHGLGLSITRRIVEKLGGQVGVDSEPGRGSTFWFSLPAARNAPDVAKLFEQLP